MNKIAPLFAFACLVACGGGSGAKSANEVEDPSSATSTAPTTTLVAPPPGDTADAPPPENKGLSDGQIARILVFVHDSEIEAARLAATKSTNANVKRYADTMVKHHSEWKAKDDQVFNQAQIAVADSTLLTDLQKKQSQVQRELGEKTRADFDKAYVKSEIEAHKDAIDLIDEKLLEAAQSPQLKAQIQSLKPTIEVHLKQAEDLEKKLK